MTRCVYDQIKAIKNFHFSAKGSPLRKKFSKFQFRVHNFFPRNRPDLIISANWALICQNYYADRKSKLTAQISRTKDRSDPNFRICARLWRPTYLLQPNYSSSKTYVQIAALRVIMWELAVNCQPGYRQRTRRAPKLYQKNLWNSLCVEKNEFLYYSNLTSNLL